MDTLEITNARCRGFAEHISATWYIATNVIRAIGIINAFRAMLKTAISSSLIPLNLGPIS